MRCSKKKWNSLRIGWKSRQCPCIKNKYIPKKHHDNRNCKAKKNSSPIWQKNTSSVIPVFPCQSRFFQRLKVKQLNLVRSGMMLSPDLTLPPAVLCDASDLLSWFCGFVTWEVRNTNHGSCGTNQKWLYPKCHEHDSYPIGSMYCPVTGKFTYKFAIQIRKM